MEESLRKSFEKIFSKFKVDAIERRLLGLNDDPNGAWSRVKPEIIAFDDIIKHKDGLNTINKLIESIKR